MIFRYVFADLTRNPRRTISTVIGVFLGIALTCSVLFFVDGLSASLTQRAVAPLPIDMQRILATSSDNLRLGLSVSPNSPVKSGQTIEVRMKFENLTATPANEVVIRSIPGSSLRYILGSARVNNKPITPSKDNPFATGSVQAGFNLGSVISGSTVDIRYQVEALSDITTSEQDFTSSFSTREVLAPVAANKAKHLSQPEIADRIRKLSGVDFAEQLSIVDLEPDALRAKNVAKGSSRIFGFDPDYTNRDTSVKIIKGSQVFGKAMISAEAAEKLAVGVGDAVSIDLPDNTKITRQISGIVDLTKARSLFSSRQGADLETFIYVPNTVVIDTQSFTQEVLPAYERAVATRGDRVKSLPIREIDIGINRELLNAEPSVALKQTEQIAQSISAVDRNEDFLLDHISNTLMVASGDAKVAKQMFVFLGLPGTILAAMLAAYAGIVLSGAQRREQATLRIRGASRKHLLSMLSLRVSSITAVGAGIGVSLGFATSIIVVGLDSLLRATWTNLFISAVTGIIAGLIATGAALYFTGRRSINQEINKDRERLVSGRPLWQRYWLDAVGIAVVVLATLLIIRSSAFDGLPGSVYVGQAVQINLGLLFLPIAAWIFGCLFGTRVFAWALARPQSFTTKMRTRPLHLLYRLSIRRRAWALAQAGFIVGLIIALGTSLAIFTASYHGAKNADARYVNGSDIRISPTAASKQTYKSADAQRLQIGGIDTVAPVLYGTQNVVLRSNRTTEVANLGALDPSAYSRAAPFDDAHFANGSAKDSLGLLSARPNSVLLSSEMAEFMQLKVGDKVYILLARTTADQHEVELMVGGLFERLPGFPDGVHALMNISAYEAEVPSSSVAFFLAQTKDTSDGAVETAVQNLRGGIAAEESLQVDSRQNALAKDQSSLASLNINGLLKIDSSYSLAMSVTVVTIFVFGLLLSRRREYVTLRAQGMSAKSIRLLIGAEAATATLAGTLIGLPVGLAMSYYFVNILRPLFVLSPPFILPLGSIGLILGLVLITTIAASMAASSLVARLKATELLRDE